MANERLVFWTWVASVPFGEMLLGQLHAWVPCRSIYILYHVDRFTVHLIIQCRYRFIVGQLTDSIGGNNHTCVWLFALKFFVLFRKFSKLSFIWHPRRKSGSKDRFFSNFAYEKLLKNQVHCHFFVIPLTSNNYLWNKQILVFTYLQRSLSLKRLDRGVIMRTF